MSATTAIVGEMTTTTITTTTTLEKRPMPQLPWKHAYRQGFATIGEGRCREPFDMYYELHGTGPKRVVLLMGKHDILHVPELFHSNHCALLGMNSPCQAWDYQASDEYTPLDETESRDVVCTRRRFVAYSKPYLDIHRPPILVLKVNTLC